MSSAQEALIKAYRELASIPGAGNKPLGDLALLALAWPYVVVLSDGSVLPESLAEELGQPPKDLLRGHRVAVVVPRAYIAPLLEALGETYVEVSKSPPALVWYPSQKYEKHVVEFVECAEQVWSGLDCDNEDYAILATISMSIMRQELERAKKLRKP